MWQPISVVFSALKRPYWCVLEGLFTSQNGLVLKDMVTPSSRYLQHKTCNFSRTRQPISAVFSALKRPYWRILEGLFTSQNGLLTKTWSPPPPSNLWETSWQEPSFLSTYFSRTSRLFLRRYSNNLLVFVTAVLYFHVMFGTRLRELIFILATDVHLIMSHLLLTDSINWRLGAAP